MAHDRGDVGRAIRAAQVVMAEAIRSGETAGMVERVNEAMRATRSESVALGPKDPID